MRDWLVVLKDGTRVKVRAAYPDSDIDGEDVIFVDDQDRTAAGFAAGTVAYYFDAALCAVIVEGPSAVTMLPAWTGTPEWLKPPFVATCGTAVPYEPPQSGMSAQQSAIPTPHDGGRNAP